MKSWTDKEEELAKEEYLLLISALQNSNEFENEWVGEWDDFKKESFGKKSTTVKGDKNKFMKYWIDDQKIINDTDWDKINTEDDYDREVDDLF